MKTTDIRIATFARTPKAPRRKAASQVSFTITGEVPPMAWKKCAHDQGYATVDDWARATLDQASWPGNRLVIAPSQKQFDAWLQARRGSGMGIHQWIEIVLDAAAMKEGGAA